MDSYYEEVEELGGITIKKQANSLPEGWIWVMYDDGSGHLESPDHKKYMIYDFSTKEYKEKSADSWSFMDDEEIYGSTDWFSMAEEKINRKYLEKEMEIQ